MAVDYGAIRAENERGYGTHIGRIGPMLLANRYEDRAHFIYELLQNAEDALARRHDWTGSRAVSFELFPNKLCVSHFGEPFTEEDVRGICGIGEGTKTGLTSIGRFGIGFKSVYAFTDCPEVHSGDEHFVIENYVWPREVSAIDFEAGETVFILPLRANDPTAHDEIAAGLRKLGPRTLLFLREIEEISWSVEGVSSGFYMRNKPVPVGKLARKVELLGEEEGSDNIVEETWLIFSREVYTDNGEQAGYVEIAFALVKDNAGIESVRPIDDSTLVVFFPTIVPTNLGFLLQGPYRRTPSRDNVPRKDPWNLKLVRESATLLVEALRVLRDMGLLNANALEAMPLDRKKFDEGSMFAPLFEAVREALISEPLLPRYGGGYVVASSAMLARTQRLRELFNPAQLANIFQADSEIAWLTEGIAQDRTPELRRYLMQELNVSEVRPEALLSKLTKSFLKAQSDEWIVQLYEFLNDQPQWQLDDIPLVRLEDGRHVFPHKDGRPQAYLPGKVETDFPTVRRTVCNSAKAREFLGKKLGLREPDPVDDVISNVLPKYRDGKGASSRTEYAGDIDRILEAFKTDSKRQRETLVSALQDCQFVAVRDAGTGKTGYAKPTQVYLASERLKELFDGVPGVLLVDDSYDCLRGEAVRSLLEACGASRYLQRMPTQESLSWEERQELRRQEGCVDYTWDAIDDYGLRGLDELLETLPALTKDRAAHKARLLWEALCDLVDRQGVSVLLGRYRWQYHRVRSCNFDAVFVRRLNEASWVPGDDGNLQAPSYILFEETGWNENAVLLSKIRFKPPIVEQLAREVGIEPGVLNLLKKLGVTSEEELKARLGIADTTQPEAAEDLTPTEAIERILGPGHEPSVPQVDGSSEALAVSGGRASTGSSSLSGVAAGDHAGGGSGRSGGAATDGHSAPSHSSGSEARDKTSGGAGSAPFISYVAVHPDNRGADPDRPEQEERQALEEQAIDLILEREPGLQRTSPNNPGFDLIQPGPDGVPVRWIEVKAMTGDLADRPVGLSRAQFEEAQRRGDRYWLYVVEHASTPEKARVVRIQDPAGKAQTFTFDHGWISVAEIDQPAKPTQMKGFT